jgi:xylitol oxidase
LHNLASLPHISVVGASATATHGSGVTNGNLASGISGLEFITGTGEIKQLTREDPEFAGAVVHLGALGIVSQVTLDIQPTYQVRQDLFQDLPFQAAVENFEEIMSAGYSVSLFTDWMNQNVSQIWIKRKVEPNLEELGPEYFGATAATRNLHPITRIPATACTEQMGVPGPWYDRLPHFKMGFLPSSGNEIQSEFFVPREHAVEAFQALERKKEIINPPLQISEVRTIAKDNLWLSPAYQKDVVAFHFTWKPDEAAVRKVLPVIEQELAPFGVLPHWGKLFTIDKATLHSRYPKMKDFLALVEQFDPERKFKNEYLKKNLYES